MANRRMFSKEIVSSDAFLDMPISSQLLYFHLGMEADDEGFIGNHKKIARMVGCNDDDLKVLISKRFILPFQSGVIVIKHWLIHNTIRMDRFNPTQYNDEKKLLFIKENKAYTDMATNGKPLGNQMVTQVKLSKVNLIKEKVDDTSFQKFWEKYPNKEMKKKSLDIWKSKKLDSKLEDILLFIEKALQSDRWKKGFIKQPPVFLRNECWNDNLDTYNDFKKSYQVSVIDYTK